MSAYAASSALSPTAPLRMVQVIGTHGADDDGRQTQRRVSVAPDGVVIVAAPNTFENTSASSGYVGYPESAPVAHSWRGAAMVSKMLPAGPNRSTSSAVSSSTFSPESRYS